MFSWLAMCFFSNVHSNCSALSRGVIQQGWSYQMHFPRLLLIVLSPVTFISFVDTQRQFNGSGHPTASPRHVSQLSSMFAALQRTESFARLWPHDLSVRTNVEFSSINRFRSLSFRYELFGAGMEPFARSVVSREELPKGNLFVDRRSSRATGEPDDRRFDPFV